MTVAAWLAIGEAIWVIGLCTWIISERRSPAATFAWVLALIWLPLLGIPLYLVFGPRRLRRKKLRRQRSISSVARSSPVWRTRPGDAPCGVPDIASIRPLATLAAATRQAAPSRAARVALLASGDDCYAAMERAILEAKHHVHLEYYIWEPDRTGTRFRDVLCQQARSGVEIRLLVDAIGSAWFGRRFSRPLREAGVRLAHFNPISLARLRPDLVNFRTHRKIVVCDGHTGFTGGINICDNHAAAITGDRAWRDTHLQIEGEPVRDLQVAFLEDWHFATGSAPTTPDCFPRQHLPATGPWVQILASGPDDDSYAIEKFCFAAIAGARRRVLVTTPYFVPTEPLLAALATAALRGVTVEILVPERSDSRLVTAAARSYYAELVHVGVRIHEYRSSMLHAKTLVVDDLALVGTANMDNRSFRLNFEVAAVLYDEKLAASLAEMFRADVLQAVEHRAEMVRRANVWQRMSEATARLLSPLL
jgi:cardiolipin synthase A/B